MKTHRHFRGICSPNFFRWHRTSKQIHNLMSRKMHMSDYLPSRHFQIFVMIHDHLVTHVASIDRVYICSQILTNTSLSQAVLSFKLVGITIFRYIYLDPPFGCQISTPPGLFLVGKRGPNFRPLEDSVNSKIHKSLGCA